MTLALDISGAPVNFDNRTPKPRPVASYDPERQTLTITNAYSVREVLRADGFKWQPDSKTWKRTMTLDELKTGWSLYSSIGIIPSAKTATLIDSANAKPVAVEVKPAQPEAKTEGWTAIAPPSVDKLKKAQQALIFLADADTARKGMRIPSTEDRDQLRKIAGWLREVLAEVA